MRVKTKNNGCPKGSTSEQFGYERVTLKSTQHCKKGQEYENA